MANELFDEYGHPIQVIVDPTNPAQLFDNYGRPFIAYEDPSGISLSGHRYEYSLGSYFYNRNKVGSGGGYGGLWYNYLNTGTTTGSSSTGDASMALATRPGRLCSLFDFNKPYMLKFTFEISVNTALTIARFQFKQVTTLGDLAAKGVGLKVMAGALYAESYGDSRKETSLSMALSTWTNYYALIVHTPATSIKFYIDSGTGWVLKYTETDTAKIPAGDSAALMSAYADVENGAGVANMAIAVSAYALAVALPKA